ncbi:MAG: LysR substrate-binding domain-containing protein [Hyphomicrobiaceae bacterium]|nr:LysR family transcriptional regulator [Hyphomicrobiaceae bacterium]
MKAIHLSRTADERTTSLPPMAALRAFERAGALLSFQEAANTLAISPSAVSHQIRGLEDRFGAPLFERNQRSVRLTRHGERYLTAVRKALEILDEAGRELIEQDIGSTSALHISSLPFFTSTVLIPSLAVFERSNPGLTLHIDTTHQHANFSTSRVDVAIRYGRRRATGLQFEPLLEVYGLPVYAPKLTRHLLKVPTDLAHHMLIAVEAQPWSWPTWFKNAGFDDIKPKGVLWVGSVPAALEAAEHGLGVALAMFPLINSRKSFGDTLIAPFAPPKTSMETIYLVTRPQQSRTKRIVAFRRWISGAVARASTKQSSPHDLRR